MLFAVLFACRKDSTGPRPTLFSVAGSWNYWSYFENVGGQACYVVGTLVVDSTHSGNTLTASFDGWRPCGSALSAGPWPVVHYAATGLISADSLSLHLSDVTSRGGWSAVSMNGTALIGSATGVWNAVSCTINACTSPSLAPTLAQRRALLRAAYGPRTRT